MTRSQLIIKPDGSVRAIYSDKLIPMFKALGVARIVRASHVEPRAGGWQAAVSWGRRCVLPVTATREASLAAEVRHLEQFL